jgi:histidinol-phosphate aminotransferase
MNPLPAHIASLRPYESARSLHKGDDWIFMDANESPVTEAIELDRLPPINRYPDPTADALRDAIAAFYNLKRHNLIMANGTDELIDLSIGAFVRPGRKVVSLAPSYGMYRTSAETAGVEFVPVPLRPDFRVDEGALWAALDEADLLFLCSPNNPTGTIIEMPLIERLMDGFPGRIVVDEAYGEFADADGVSSSVELVRGGAENLIVMRTFSKAFAAAGLRLGYGVADSAAIDVLLRMKPPYNVGAITQAAGLKIWNRRGVMERNVRALIAERSRLMQGCRQLDCFVFPSEANFFLMRPPAQQRQTAETIYQSLLERHRLIVRRFAGRPGLEGLLRISVGLPEHNHIFLSTLRDLLR